MSHITGTSIICSHPSDGVMWNPWNHLVQCHRCGADMGEYVTLPRDELFQQFPQDDPDYTEQIMAWVDEHSIRHPTPNLSDRHVKLLHLERDEDPTGISGTGVVAYGCQFADQTIVLRWDTQVRSTVFYDSIEDLITITGHDGKTRVVWG
jgi:hypothetical protein